MRPLLFLLSLLLPAQAQLNMTSGTLAPALGPYDQAYLPGAVVEGTDTMGSAFGASGNNDQYTYVSSPDRTSKAQSFTTGTNAAGYVFRSFTLRQAYAGTNAWLGNGTYFLLNNGDTFAVRVGTISGTSYTVLLETNAVYTGASINTGGTGSALGTYFTFDLSGASLTLNPNTTCFFELAATNGSDHFELNNTSTNPASRAFPPLYTKGRAFFGNTVNHLDRTGALGVPPQGGVFEFVAAVRAAGAPTVGVSVTPNQGVIGQSFKVAATVASGAGTVTNVAVNLSAIGGPAAASLVLSNANVYTNTFTVPAGAAVGSAYLTVTAADTTPLQGAGSALFTVLAPQTTTVNPARTFQTIEGLGGALSFYEGWLTALPSSYKQEIYTNAFAGLNLSMLRFGNWYRYQTPTMGFHSAATEIVANANRVLGRPIPVYMSSWSPPAFLKSNGQVGHGGTLITTNGGFAYDGFAQYWYDAINAYQSNGVPLTWISIQNEPDWAASYDSCIFHPTEDTVNGTNYASYSKALDAVYLQLTNLPSPPKLLAPEVVHVAYNDLANYAATLNSNHFYGLNFHLYGDDNNSLASSTNVYPGKPHFMTEYGVSGLVETGLLIHDCLTLANCSGFNYWSLVWPGTEGGLIQIENPYASQSTWTNAPPGVPTQSHGWWLTPAYWGMKHFSYYIQPGYQRVSVSDTDNNISSSAYLSPDGLRLVVVLINPHVTAPSQMNFNFGGFPADRSSVFQTAGANTYAGTNTFLSLGALPAVQTLPPQSITTVVLDRMVAVGAAANPTPAHGAGGIPLTSALSWAAGSNAVLQAVYLGTSSNAVAQATPASPQFLGIVTNRSLSPTFFANVTNYWRVDEIAGIATNTGAVWSFSPAPIVKLTGTVVGSPGSWGGGGNTIARAFDGSTNTYYDAVNGTGDWAGLDLGGATADVVVQIKYCPRATFAARMVGGQFQGASVSNFSSGVVTLFTVSAIPPDGTLTVQTLTNTTPFRYLRYIGPANGNCNVAEVEFWGTRNTAPTLAAIASRTIGAGMTLNLTNVATDLDASSQTLTFSLPTAPTNAAIDTTSGALTWRPLVTQANTTNPFTVRVADSGTPSLSATQSFVVTVTNLPRPAVGNPLRSGGQLVWQVTGATGPDYQIQASTNLVDWSAVFTTNSPAMPFAWTNSILGVPMNFFRIQAGPPF